MSFLMHFFGPALDIGWRIAIPGEFCDLQSSLEAGYITIVRTVSEVLSFVDSS